MCLGDRGYRAFGRRDGSQGKTSLQHHTVGQETQRRRRNRNRRGRTVGRCRCYVRHVTEREKRFDEIKFLKENTYHVFLFFSNKKI